MCRRAGLLIGFDHAAKRGIVAWANCDSWACPECAKRKRDSWSLRAQIGTRQFLSEYQFLDFVTLTSHEKLKDFRSTERVWREAWPTVYNAIKRRNTNFQYLMIPEKHKDGRMHMHCLWTAGCPKRQLKAIVRKRGLGYMLDVSAIVNPIQAVFYVVKYLSKDLGIDVPEHFHRVRVSRGWPEIEKPNTGASALDWMHVSNNAQLNEVYIRCKWDRITLIDQKTGLIFDDVDLDHVIPG